MFEKVMDIIFSSMATLWVNYKLEKYGIINLTLKSFGMKVTIYRGGKATVEILEEKDYGKN